MGIGELLKEIVSNAVDSYKESTELQKNRDRLIGILRLHFEEKKTASELPVGEFFTSLFGDEGEYFSSSDELDKPELEAISIAWVFIYRAFLYKCVEAEVDHHFSSLNELSSLLHKRFRRFRKIESRREFAEKVIMQTLLPIDEHVDRNSDIRMFAFLAYGLNRIKRCSLDETLGEDANNNFQSWLEEAVDPILKLIEDQRLVLEYLLAGALPVEAHISAFKKFLQDDAKIEDLIGENQGEMVQLYKAMHDAFDRKGLIAINKLATVPKDVHRINQIETIIDLYNLKISRTEKDKKIDEDVKARKVQALQHLMEKDIEALGGAV